MDVTDVTGKEPSEVSADGEPPRAEGEWGDISEVTGYSADGEPPRAERDPVVVVGGVRFGLAQSRLSMPPTMGTLAGLQLVMLVSVRRSRSFCLVLTDVVNVVEVVVGLRSLGVMLL